MKKYNLSNIMKRAWELVKKAGMTISSGLKKAWEEAKNMANEIKNVTIETFASYNVRRYSKPWVCKMEENGKYNFKEEIGTYTAAHGDEGELVVYEPVNGQVYGYGQKDYRGESYIRFAKWNGTEFVACNKMGN
ncbi:MAG: hypothetical protein Q4F03_12535 [Eubacteriales bacterium]|nr:hypothetical protein [Eubacteriales bacterium]